MKKIGITGTIASGKTTVSILLRRKGYRVFDCDGYTRSLYLPGQPVYEAIVDTFGEDILDGQGEIDRASLAGIVFSNEEARVKLNSIVHPAVLAGMERFFFNHQEEPLVFAEVPLLFEAHMESAVDEILVVACEHDTAIQRMKEDRGYSEEEAERRYQAMVHPSLQKEQAHYVILNDGTLSELNDKVIAWLEQMEDSHVS
ncbi:MAG: dephospho-CoA kinase [Solobacterium sp.]|nr:dephospho-CoA kinase [Solobacterium sp.]